MHSHHINYLIAQERAADLRRPAERARLGADDAAGKATIARRGVNARTFVRLRLRVARRAASQSPS